MPDEEDGVPPARRFGTATLAAATTFAFRRAAARLPASITEALARTNHRGEPVTLAEGPTTALGATLAAVIATAGVAPRVAAAAGVAGLGAAAVGAYDDVVGARPDQRADKGFRGHLNALRAGRVSAGAVKVAGVGASALVAGALLPRSRSPLGAAVDTALAATVVAGAANVVNLFDLRPGRALKVGLLAAGPLLAGERNGSATVASAVTGAALTALPDDLGERSMLGDAGANAVGALLGVAAAARLGRAGRALTAAGLIGLMAASEKVSFTAVIARTPVLDAVDQWGRRAPHPEPAAGVPTAGEPAAEVTAAPTSPRTGEPGHAAGER
ncbi:hypothetical protein GCM10009539_76750 [Cryptosporangium japonicum]|uniref:UDP-N-acetylmuramyl pentapeptide phosphotransferase/UDP-N-acetylglucosamine-1-phosphate transferase n=1 Tax=Cryptosporangium japonicum TaxID=80872 RepID=A0ABN0V6W0_9ACTN